LPKPNPTWKKLRDHALAKPEAYQDFPWGELVAKVAKKIFVFLGDPDGGSEKISFKLLASHEVALAVPGAQPVGYGLGRSGWVTVPLGTSAAPFGVLAAWIDESYDLVAPKRLLNATDVAPAKRLAKSPGAKSRSAGKVAARTIVAKKNSSTKAAARKPKQKLR